MSARQLSYPILFLAAIAACSGESARTGEVQQRVTTCVDVPASADAVLSAASLKQNDGAQPVLHTSERAAALLQFELGAIPQHAAIESATLKLHASQAPTSGPTTINVHRAKAAWSEQAVTFRSFGQAFDHHVIGSITINGPHVQQSVDLTSTVQSWLGGAQPNHGIVLRTAAAHETMFVSREGALATQQPVLQVCYTSLETDDCSANPCQNGGKCTNLPQGGHVCACQAGYEGHNCQHPIDSCAGNPCLNGGTCIDGVGSYTCTCLPGYDGPNCETNIDECASAPCQNGGACTDGINTYTCSCPAGYTGPDCEINIDECAPAPCQNGGTCTDGINGYSCACAAGYEGLNCEINIDECAPAPCQNGGTCTDGANSYSCACAAGYTGPSCEINIDECAPAPCQNGGTCVDGVASYTCSCPIGFTGPNCEINVDDCSGGPCQNGGTCNDAVNSYTCSCLPGYTGANCEIDIDECAPAPCQNGGTCTDSVNSYTCSCPAGYTGTDCEINIDDCSPNQCQNGGTCSDGVNAFTCQCTIDWVGPLCETNACEDNNPCTLDDNTPAGCVYTPSPSAPACRAAMDSLASGAYHSCAIRQGGQVFCWGMRDGGRLGHGVTTAGYALAPVQVTGITDAVAIDAGYDHSCAVRANGTVACWGENAYGQLGTGTTTPSAVPVAVAGITDATAVATARSYTCLLRQSGELRCFGRGIEGQLGQGAFASSLAPVKVNDTVDLVGPTGTPQSHAPIPWVSVTATELFTCGMRASGQVLCWGANGNGQLGFGATGNRNLPALVANLTDAITVGASRTHACAVRATGNVACWGSSYALGRTGVDLLVPVLIGNATNPFANAVTVTASGYHTCATTTFGRTWCWGQSQQGELGKPVGSALPIAIAGSLIDTSSVATSSGFCHSCTLLENGTLRCWGAEPALDVCRSQLGTGLSSGSYAPVTPLLP